MRPLSLHALAATVAFALLCACAQAQAPSAGAPLAASANRSILAWSTPAAGSTVPGPVNEIQFHFAPPARLGEVTVTGPDGTMPMMITAVGEVEHYSIPASGLGPGAYSVNWRATTTGAEHSGGFNFSVK